MPDLRRACRLHGVLVGLGLGSWDDGVREVWRIAGDRGAFFLPDALLDDLADWITAEITDQAEGVGSGIEPGLAGMVAALPDAIRSRADWAAYRRVVDRILEGADAPRRRLGVAA